MRPAEGLSTPVSRLITVVLPAPFGPISAWRAPFSILSDTPATAAIPPKCFSRPWVSSATGMSGLLRLDGLGAPLPRRADAASDLGDTHVEQGQPFADVAVAEPDCQHDQRTLEERQVEPVAGGKDDEGDQAAIDAAEQHQHHQQQSDPILPILRVEGGEDVLDQLERDR